MLTTISSFTVLSLQLACWWFWIFSQIHAVLLCIKHTKCLKWLLHYVHDFNIKTRGSCFCGKKSIPVPAGKKSTSTWNIALDLVSLVRFFLVRFWFYQLANQMCSLNFNHYYLLWQYDNINVGDDIKCKSIELFLYRFYIVVVCKYICGAFSGHVRAIKKHG